MPPSCNSSTVPSASSNALAQLPSPGVPPRGDSAWLRLEAKALALVATFATLGPSASGQCTHWLPAGGFPGPGTYATTHWDPDGAGPMQPRLVAAGWFSAVGNTWANNIAMQDPISGAWSPLGSGTDGQVYALSTLANGDLVVGGQFTTAGGVQVNGVARWDGTSWSALGSGVSGAWPAVAAITKLANGDVVVGGGFTTAGGTPANHIARWDGISWSPLGSGTNGFVLSLCTMPNGDLVAGGEFTSAGGGVPVHYIARWNGSGWSALGSGMGAGPGHAVPYVRTLATANGDLIAGGDFTIAGGAVANRVARWDGSNWWPLGGGTGDRVKCILPQASGSIVVGGAFLTAGGISTSARNIALWNGSAWSALGSGVDGEVHSLTTSTNGNLVAAGGPDGIVRWDGMTWSPLVSGENNGPIHAVARLPNGDIVVGGTFTKIGGVAANGVARWDGTGWAPLGSGVSLGGAGGWVLALAPLPNGDIIAGGFFYMAGGVSAQHVARWNGVTWSPLGSGITSAGNNPVRALAAMPDGSIVVGGSFQTAGGISASNIARWNGSTWSALGSGTNAAVNALATMPNGQLVAAGDFTTVGGVVSNFVARWTGTAWSSMASGMNAPVYSLLLTRGGHILAGGGFSIAGSMYCNNIARWNGTTWSALGSGMNGPTWGGVMAMEELPDGKLVAGGDFSTAGGVTANNIARWNGSAWSSLGSGTDSYVLALRMGGNDELVAGGSFDSVDGSVSRFLARITTTCPATATTYGTGCIGSAGPLTLTPTQLPWLGSTYRATATGFAPGALAFELIGWTSTATPLVSLHPAGGPGCSLLVDSATTRLLLPTNGTAVSQMTIPNAPFLIGAPLHNQVLQLELDPSLALQAIGSTNAVTLTIGSF